MLHKAQQIRTFASGTDELGLKLSDEDRRRFLYWVDDHRHELLPNEDDIHPDVKAEILRRRDEVDAHPKSLETWERTTERVRARVHELRRQKAQAH